MSTYEWLNAIWTDHSATIAWLAAQIAVNSDTLWCGQSSSCAGCVDSEQAQVKILYMVNCTDFLTALREFCVSYLASIVEDVIIHEQS